MPYIPHPLLAVPANENAKIWRYLSFPKFLSMLDMKSLYFTVGSKFIDIYEGKFPIANVRKIYGLVGQEKDVAFDNMGMLEKITNLLMRINCWNLSDYESTALWMQYVQNKGVAIQSTFKRFKDSFENSSEDIEIGVVKYIDGEVEMIPEDNAFYLFSHKRRYYEHEKEIRAFVFGSKSEKNRQGGLPQHPQGMHIPVNLDVLIEKVVLYPNAHNWLQELVKSIMKKYGLAKDVVFSEIIEKS